MVIVTILRPKTAILSHVLNVAILNVTRGHARQRFCHLIQACVVVTTETFPGTHNVRDHTMTDRLVTSHHRLDEVVRRLLNAQDHLLQEEIDMKVVTELEGKIPSEYHLRKKLDLKNLGPTRMRTETVMTEWNHLHIIVRQYYHPQALILLHQRLNIKEQHLLSAMIGIYYRTPRQSVRYPLPP